MSFQDLDFKLDRRARPRQHKAVDKPSILPSKNWLKLLVISTAVILLGFSASSWQLAAKGADSTLMSTRLHYALTLPEAEVVLETDKSQPEILEQEDDWQTITIKSGDTLASIFSAAGLSSRTTYEVAGLNEQTKALRYIQPGQKVQLLVDDEKRLRQMKYQPDITKTLALRLNEDQSYSSQIINYKLDPYPVFREGTINSSLFEAALENDVPETIVMELANIFGWDIDFSLDIRQGDRFGIVYEELYKNGTKIRNGRILSAEFLNNGKLYKAVYYTDPKGDGGYFNENGKSMRKAFLRSPVEFARISSRFSNNRWHPVLSKWRSHNGVDYAAARGTPIRASGDGKVVFIGTKGGYGNTIILGHGGRYTTLYAHLNRYARDIGRGARVKQGQIIAYVGSSGLATGPHLHYEFRVNGVHRNPLTVSLPEAEPVHPSYQQHFEENTQAYLSMLQLMDNTLAENTN